MRGGSAVSRSVGLASRVPVDPPFACAEKDEG